MGAAGGGHADDALERDRIAQSAARLASLGVQCRDLMQRRLIEFHGRFAHLAGGYKLELIAPLSRKPLEERFRKTH
jgi:hypothetical protein